MNPLVKWRLRMFCKKHEIDYQEIDSTLTYAENMQHLNEFVPKSLEDLANEDGKVYEVMEKEIPMSERYGVIPASQEQPLLMFKTVVYLVTRSIVLVKSHLARFDKQVRFFGHYIEITAQITEITAMIQLLEAKGVKVQFVGSSMVHQRAWQYIDGQGWRKTV